MRTYLISLRGDHERKRRALEHLEKAGYQRPELFDAINGEATGLTTKFTHTLPDGTVYSPPPKHVGLCLSHWLIWDRENSSHSDDNCFAIMEDDVVLHEDWAAKLYDALLHVPPDWDLLYAGNCHVRTHGAMHVSGPIWTCAKPCCTHFYLVRYKALPVLIEKCERIYTNIDWAMIEQALPHLKAFCALPRIAGQHGLEDLAE